MLCNWKPGDILSAYHLNQMTCAINSNTEGLCTVQEIVGEKGSSTINSTGGIDMGAFMTSGLEPDHYCANRGYIKTGWEFTPSGCSIQKGIFVDKSGVENASQHCYPCLFCSVQISDQISSVQTQDIMLRVTTDCYGNVISKCITGVPIANDDFTSNYWQGPIIPGSSEPVYQFERRLGRIVDDNNRPVSSEDSNLYNKIIKTNDLIMPILPGRTEPESMCDSLHSVSLLNGYAGNTALVKNIANVGGLTFNSAETRIEIASGIEFHLSTDSTGSGTFDVTPHIQPCAFNVNILDIPVKQTHYNWCESTGTWNCLYTTCSSNIKLNAQTIDNNKWQVGWTSSGEINIPVYNFTPSGGGGGTTYRAGDGIDITNNCISALKAHSANSKLGSVYNITQSSQITEPYIDNGHIVIPQTPAASHNVCHITSPLPVDGSCGWVLSAYMPMVYQVSMSSDTMVSFKQLMRFNGSNLEVSWQRAIMPNGQWCAYGMCNYYSV